MVPRWQEAVEWQACMTQGRMSRGTYIRIGSSFNNQVARPTALGASGVDGGVELRMSRIVSSSVVCHRPLPASSWMSEREGRWCQGRRGSRGFCGARADLGGYGKNRTESDIGRRQSPPAAGTAIDGGNGGRNTSDESLRSSRKVINPHTWLMCAKIFKLGGGEREPIQDSTFSAGH